MRGDEFNVDPKTGNVRRVRDSKGKEGLENPKPGHKTKKPSSKSSGRKNAAERQGKVAKNWSADLPAGGKIILESPFELEWFLSNKKRYEKSYSFTQPNDLSRFSQLLVCEMQVNRMMQRIGGKVAVYDGDGNVEEMIEVPAEERSTILVSLPKLQEEIRKLEAALRIDKKSREGDGVGEVKEYMQNLKIAANTWGVHLSERYKIIDCMLADLMWMMRVHRLDDDEDRAYHNLETADKFINQIEKMLEEITVFDKKFRKDKHSVFLMKGVP